MTALDRAELAEPWLKARKKTLDKGKRVWYNGYVKLEVRMRYNCACGFSSTKGIELHEHIAWNNPHWPLKSTEDKHWFVTEEEAKQRRKAQEQNEE